MNNLSAIERNVVIDKVMASEISEEEQKVVKNYAKYCEDYFKLSEEEQKIEMDRVVKIIVTDILPHMVKEIGFNDGMVVKNSEYFNEDGTPKEQSVV